MSISELEKKLDKEINKKDSDRFLFSKTDELLLDFKLPSFCTFNKYDYWRIVFYIKLSCSKFNDKGTIMKNLKGWNMIDEITKKFVFTRAGFFARIFFPRIYNYRWIEKVERVNRDIIGHIL